MPRPAPFPRLDILPPAQQAVWQELRQIPPEFTLYGGTAIALYLGHRESVDFDFFGTKHFAPLDLFATLPLLTGATITQSEPNTLGVIVHHQNSPVKMSFFGTPAIKALAMPTICTDNGLKVASMRDLSGMKAAVVQQRAEAKDYIDIDAILTETEINLEAALGAALAIYGPSFSPTSTLKALTYFEEPSLDQVSDATRVRLAAAVKGVDLARIPTFTPLEASI